MPPADDGGSPITNYTIYRGTTSGGEVFYDQIGNITTYNDTGLTNYQRYFYQVAAENAFGEGTRSVEISAVPGRFPGPPLSLTAVGGDSNVSLAWSPPSDDGGSPIVNYTIYRGFSSGSETYLTSIGNVTLYTDTGLTNGLTYFYKVAAVNAFGEGPLSTGASATPATVPGPPTGVVAMNGLSKIILQWQTPSNDGGFPVTNYSVYRGLAPGGESHLDTIGNMLTYTDLNVVNGQRYYYVVSAINAVGEGPLSLEVSAIPCDKPSAPLNLVAVGGDGKVELTWAPPATDNGTPVTNYFVYRSVVPAPESLLVTLGNVLNYTDTAVTNGQLYTYRVSAKNMAGEGSKSNAASATPASVPGSPIGLAAMAGDGQVTLTWSPPASDGGVPITNYVVYRGFSPGTVFPLTTLGNVLTHTDTGLTNGRTYYYQVSSVNARGEGPRSNEASATPVATPSQPRNLVARSEIEQVTLTWVQPSNDGGSPIVNYSIYRGTTQGGETFLLSVGNVLTYTDSNVAVGVTYYYEVTAHNVIGESQRSNEASATPIVRPTPPSAPQNLQAVAGNRHVMLTWSPPISDGNSPITNYRIYEGTSQGNEVFLAELGNVLTYTSTSLANGQTYYYVVKAWNAVGESVASNGASAMPVTLPGPPLGIVAVAGDGQVTISWSPPSDDGGSPIIGYNIYQGTSPGDETLHASVGTVLNYTDTGLTNGQRYFYRISAKSAVGESTLSSEVSAIPRLHTGNMLPLCTITSPPEGSTVSGTVLLAGTATDFDGTVVRVEVKIGDGSWITATGTLSWAYPFNTTTVADGQYTIRVRSFDGTDYSYEDSVTVNIDNVGEPSEGPLIEQGWFWGLLLMAVIGIVLVAYMFMERRRHPPVEEEQEEESED